MLRFCSWQPPADFYVRLASVPPDAVDYGLAPGERSVSAKDEDDCVILYSF
jgi:hypothetical protein